MINETEKTTIMEIDVDEEIKKIMMLSGKYPECYAFRIGIRD